MSEKTVTYIIIAFLSIFLIFCLCGEEVHTDGNGADAVRDELRQAGINNAEQSRRVEELEETNNRIDAGEQEALAIIRECKQLLRTVRERGEAQTPES